MILVRLFNNFLTKKLHFNYIELICIVLLNRKKNYFKFGKN
jgi:hypothetical protein